MIRDVFHGIGGIGVYGIVSTLLFMLVFAAMILRVFMMKRADIDRAKAMPLDAGELPPDQGELRDE